MIKRCSDCGVAVHVYICICRDSLLVFAVRVMIKKNMSYILVSDTSGVLASWQVFMHGLFFISIQGKTRVEDMAACSVVAICIYG